ncbi:hypothetical protein NDU88_006568 [Pleurodeles waltl]|uniref:Uncharacterized protein n=1 Tax=Pleurodeles waltl TaxID=8319 RepID=A0AAV7SPW7_PLEWA|nr:hypothetical protein NDU88_006568 [Pleurodeles waltl]
MKLHLSAELRGRERSPAVILAFPSPYAKHNPASGNPPDKPDENAKTRGIGTTEKIARALADHKESKWRLPPGLGSAGPRTCGRGAESLPRTRGTGPRPWIVPVALLRFCRAWGGGEVIRTRTGGDAPTRLREWAARCGLPGTGPRSGGRNRSMSGSRRGA